MTEAWMGRFDRVRLDHRIPGGTLSLGMQKNAARCARQVPDSQRNCPGAGFRDP
jgi:hypothetical protein